MGEYTVVWNGRDELTESMDRDYAAMGGEGWDPIWEPTSPLTTPWSLLADLGDFDPNQHVRTPFGMGSRRKGASRILRDWVENSSDETVIIDQSNKRRIR